MRFCMRQTRRGQVGVVLKLDFKKAYDKVYWVFLIQCLQARGSVGLGFHG
jgi:hypothetical protein